MKPIYILFLIPTIFSCSSHESCLFEISPETFGNEKITLAEIADDIKYIPFDNSFPIGPTFCISINNDNIYLSIKDVGVVQFDRQGRFVSNIGRMGRGPGEYKGMYFTIDGENKRIYVLDLDKIKVYSHDGSFLRDFSYKKYIADGAGGIEMFNSLLFIPDYLVAGDRKFNWIFLDTLGNLVSKKDNSTPPFVPDLGLKGTIYKYENKLFYFNLFNDTIFSISSTLKTSPAYLFSKDANRRPTEEYGINPLSQVANLFRTGNMFETKEFIFLEYAYRDRAAILLINKILKNKYLAYKDVKKTGIPVSTRACIINNLDGGMPLSIRPIYYYYTEDDSEYICSLINPFALKTYISSDEFINSVPRYPDKKLDLEKLANNLKEADNPVLMIVRLKK